jgi:hypothetical protein
MDTATATAVQSADPKAMTRELLATKADGAEVRVTIPSQLFAALAETTQGFLLHSIAIAQRMGGIAILPATRLAPLHRGSEYHLAISTEQLGTVAFQLTPAQWQELEAIVAQARAHGATLQ